MQIAECGVPSPLRGEGRVRGIPKSAIRNPK